MKITKKELRQRCIANETAIASLELILKENGIERQPQLKQLDYSAFDHPYVDDRFKYVALNADGQAVFFESKPVISNCLNIWVVHTGSVMPMLKGYDTSNWQNSLIERDVAKELTGSDYYYSKSVIERLENGQELVMCFVSNVSESDAMQERHVEVITSVDTEFNDTDGYGWQYAVPINNQGEPLTAAEAGL